METVKQFSSELNSVYEVKPPISRAKMANITKLAMKASKYYKHIVMIVEKFIAKCSPEYKVPGLYVVDSIVRQSRHQLGLEKDSFGPRFSKNFQKTFHHLFQCSQEDQAKVLRVLNLWQKNNVFSPEVIQPLLSLVTGPGSQSSPSQPIAAPLESTSSSTDPQSLDLNSASTIIQQQQQQIQALLQQQQQLQSQANNLLGPALQGLLTQSHSSNQADTLTSLLQQAQQLQHLQAIQQHLVSNGGPGGGNPPAQTSNAEGPSSHNQQTQVFNQALLDDFDYSDEDEDMEKRLAQQRERMLQQKSRLEDEDSSPGGTDPTSVLEQLQQQFRAQESAIASANMQPVHSQTSVVTSTAANMPLNVQSSLLTERKLPEENLHQIPKPSSPPPLPPPPTMAAYPPPPLHPSLHPNYPPPPLPPPHMHNHRPPGPRGWGHHPPPPLPPPHYPPPPRSPPSRRDRYHSPPLPLRGRSPSPPRRHWRDRWSPRRRSRSPPPHRSRSPHRRSPRRRMSPPPPLLTAVEREKQRKGIPPAREKHVTVCSRTIWIGHLAKSVSREQVTQAFEDFGQVKSVELVQARGCAYVVMMHRSDSVRALNSLRDLRLNGNTCKLAWAPGRGVKGATFKSFWELDLGASFVPWDKVQGEKELELISEGGWIDPSTCPPGVKPPQPKGKEEPATVPSEPPPLPSQHSMGPLPIRGPPVAVPVPLSGSLSSPPLPQSFPPPPFTTSAPPLPAFTHVPTSVAVVTATHSVESSDTIATNDDMQIDNSPQDNGQTV